MKFSAVVLGSILLGVGLTSCQMAYVWKQGQEQLALGRSQVPLEAQVVYESLSPPQRRQLNWIPRILDFCIDELGLTPGDSYQTFLDTGRQPVSHIVLAAHPEALIGYRWCFPFVGCVPYKGHFDAKDAQREAEQLRQEGWDVTVLPVNAYSTLGWFQDPILSTMLDRRLPSLVELLIHETVHRTLYYTNQTAINECLATLVARVGTVLFFEKYATAVSEEELLKHERDAQRRAQDAALLERLRADLDVLYKSERFSKQKLDRKEKLFDSARRARSFLHGREIPLPTNNAYVLASANYYSLLPLFENLLDKVGGHPKDLMAYLTSEKEDKGTLPEELQFETP